MTKVLKKAYKVTFKSDINSKQQSWVFFADSNQDAMTIATRNVKREYPNGIVISVSPTIDPRSYAR